MFCVFFTFSQKVTKAVMDKRQMFISHVMFIQKYTVIKHLVNPGFKWNCYGRDITPSKQ